MERDNAIGVFDSGFGGLSLVKEILRQLPEEEIIYFADTARCPYGVRSLTEVRRFVFEIIEFLEGEGVKMVVIACNTATAAGHRDARERFSIPIVGVIEPGSKAAVRASINNRIGVIATDGTIESRAYQTAIRALNQDALVFGRGCQKFVDLVEDGKTEGREVEEAAVECLSPLLKENIDILVLGCTHFHFLRDVIEETAGDGIEIVDPAYPTVENVKHILELNGLSRRKGESAVHQFYTTGDVGIFKRIGENLLGESLANLKRVHVHEIVEKR